MALNHAKAGEIVALRPLRSALGASKTMAIVKSDRFETMRLVLPSGTAIPSHHVEGYVTLFCLEGRVLIDAEENIELRQWDWVFLKRNVSYAVRAAEDSSVLLTILFDR